MNTSTGIKDSIDKNMHSACSAENKPIDSEVKSNGRAIEKFRSAINFLLKIVPNKNQETRGIIERVWLEAKDPKHRYWKGLVGMGSDGARKVWLETKAYEKDDLFTWMDKNPETEILLEKGDVIKIKDIPSVKYFSEKEKTQYIAMIKNGIFLRLDGSLINTLSSKSSTKAHIAGDGYAILVVDKNKQIYIYDYIVKKQHHSSITGGEPTYSTGLIKIEEGTLKSFIPYSGHYHTKKDDLMKMMYILKNHAIDLSKINFQAPHIPEKEINEILKAALEA